MSSHLKRSKSDFLRVTLFLFLITSIVGGLLAVVHHFTAPIAQRSVDDRLSVSMRELFSDAEDFKMAIEYPSTVLLGTVEVPVNSVYLAKDKNGELLGYCVNVSPKGYVDIIDMAVAIKPDGAVSDVEILSISETPGSGLKVQTTEEFRSALIGISDTVKPTKADPASKNEVEIIAGATVSSEAYINGVNAAVEVVQLLRIEEVTK